MHIKLKQVLRALSFTSFASMILASPCYAKEQGQADPETTVTQPVPSPESYKNYFASRRTYDGASRSVSLEDVQVFQANLKRFGSGLSQDLPRVDQSLERDFSLSFSPEKLDQAFEKQALPDLAELPTLFSVKLDQESREHLSSISDEARTEMIEKFSLPEIDDLQSFYQRVSDMVLQLNQTAFDRMKAEGISADSERFLDLISDTNRGIYVRSEGVGYARLINVRTVNDEGQLQNNLVIRFTDFVTGNAVFIGHKDVISHKNRDYRKVFSRALTMSGASTKFNTRGRTVIEVKTLDPVDPTDARHTFGSVSSVKLTKKPFKWLSARWYSHWVNSVFNVPLIPKAKTVGFAVFSSLMDVGLMYACNWIKVDLLGMPSNLTPAAVQFGATYSLIYGLWFTSAMREEVLWGNNKGVRSFKQYLHTFSYAIPFSIAVGEYSVIGIGVVVNKAADVYSSMLTKTRDSLGISKEPVKINMFGMDWEFNFGGHRADIEANVVRYGRGLFKNFAYTTPGIGYIPILATAPLFAIAAYLTAEKHQNDPDRNPHQTQAIMDDADSFFARLYVAFRDLGGIIQEEGVVKGTIQSTTHIRDFLSWETYLTKLKLKQMNRRTLSYFGKGLSKTCRFVFPEKEKSAQITDK